MHPKLQAVVNAIDYYQLTYPEDACVLIFDKEKVIGYKAGIEVDLKIRLGETVEKHKNTTSVRAMRSGKFLREERGPELFGFSYVATSTPIFDGREVIGVVTGVVSNSRLNEMRNISNVLSHSVEEMSATTEELTSASTDMAQRLDNLSQFTSQMEKDIQHINSIVNAVKDIALKSKILGLNASIEAARSGEHGKGFAVVANEIQKMAQDSTSSAENIFQQLQNIKQAIHYVNDSTTQIAAFTQQYTSGMHEMKGEYTHISDMSKRLSELGAIK